MIHEIFFISKWTESDLKHPIKVSSPGRQHRIQHYYVVTKKFLNPELNKALVKHKLHKLSQTNRCLLKCAAF